MYVLVTDTGGITQPDSGINFIVKERVQRVRRPLLVTCFVFRADFLLRQDICTYIYRMQVSM